MTEKDINKLPSKFIVRRTYSIINDKPKTKYMYAVAPMDGIGAVFYSGDIKSAYVFEDNEYFTPNFHSHGMFEENTIHGKCSYKQEIIEVTPTLTLNTKN